MPAYLPRQMLLPNGAPSPKGELRFGACVWFYKQENGKIQLLAQKRAKTVHNGGFYDASAGGHVDLGEDVLTAALRETKEELGVTLSPDELEFLCAYRVADKIVYFYLSDRTGKNDVFSLDPEEVESVKWVALEDLETFRKTKIKPNFRGDKFQFDLLKESLEAHCS
ncbi:NUDIX domain-containing protein [Candidatus Saccharibacteria bacterium]|nr:NUDIX domain-containing protein [Candidatus Saccharibacteria bacterium]